MDETIEMSETQIYNKLSTQPYKLYDPLPSFWSSLTKRMNIQHANVTFFKNFLHAQRLHSMQTCVNLRQRRRKCDHIESSTDFSFQTQFLQIV
jgi:hypothetical protein